MALPAAVQAAARGFIASCNQKDPNVLMAHFDDDATVKLPNGTTCNGAAEIRSKFAVPTLASIRLLTNSNEAAIMIPNGCVVHATGDYTEVTTDGKTETVALWTRQADGSRKITSFEVMAPQ